MLSSLGAVFGVQTKMPFYSWLAAQPRKVGAINSEARNVSVLRERQ